MSDAINKLKLSPEQAFALSALRDCGVIRARGEALAPYMRLVGRRYATANWSADYLYADFRPTQLGLAAIGK